ncbi:MAG: hypothetical protein C4589_09735 [Peptococcaceae bacterium]|nr:MAG: hypothetical protein C4589_09735 [Peptococcaceae bacterium]
MTYKGIVKGSIIELAEDLPLPEGTLVEISVSVPCPEESVQIILECAGMLKDLTPRQEAVFAEAMTRRPIFSRRLSL